MDATLRALGELIIQALPTFFIVLLLHFYLKGMFFKPLARVLAERNEATQGARLKAAAALEQANVKAAAYEEYIRVARNELYREQEEQRRLWREQQTSQIAEARKSAESLVAQARAQIAVEAGEARQALARETDLLAERITRSILHGRAA